MSNLYTLMLPVEDRVVVTTNQSHLDRRYLADNEAENAVVVMQSFVTVGDPAGDHEHMHPAMHQWALIAASLSVLYYHSITLSNGKWVYSKVDNVDPLVVFAREEFVSLRHCIRRFCSEIRLEEPFQYHLEDSNHISSRNVEGFATWS